jgi:hypothetical protein
MEDQSAPHNEQQFELLHQLQAYSKQVGRSIRVQLVRAQLPCRMASRAGHGQWSTWDVRLSSEIPLTPGEKQLVC